MMKFIKPILYALVACTATSASFGQLPPFKFIGVPDRPSPTGEVALLNDRILIETDDETSTWDKQSKRCYVYHRSTKRWSPLPRLDNFFKPWRARWRLVFHVHNDTLVSFMIGSRLDSIVVWNIDADSLMYKIENYGNSDNNAILHPLNGFIQYYQSESNHSQLNLHVTSLVDGTTEFRPVRPPGDSDFVKKIIPRKSGGFWLQTDDALWWTERFDTYTRVMKLLDYDECRGGIDGDRVHVVRFHQSPTHRATFITIMSPSSESALFSIEETYFASFVGIDTSNRAWFYRYGADDGFYVASSEVPLLTRYSQFDKRTNGVSLHIGLESWMAATSHRGLSVSEDAGQTWEYVTLPHPTPERIDTLAGIQPVDDGGVMLTNTIYYFQKHDSMNFEIVGTQSDGRGWPISHRWYHTNHSWLRSNGSRVEVSDTRGIMTQWDIFSNDYSYMFKYRDTVFVRWHSIYPDTAIKVAKWVPGSSTLQADSATSHKYRSVFTVQPLSGRTVWFGGNRQQYSYSQTGKVENLQTVHLSEPFCSRYHPLLNAVVSSTDSLTVLMHSDYGNCYVVLSIPLKNLKSYSIQQQEIPLAYNGKLIPGHDQQLIGILDNKAYILAPDMRSASLQEFTNVTEKRIIDVAYDDINHVYYVLTERGLYRSEPVITSVSSDVRRPSSSVLDPSAEIPLQSSWYNTLGEQVHVPSVPGLYLKITFDGSGAYLTEKIMITYPR